MCFSNRSFPNWHRIYTHLLDGCYIGKKVAVAKKNSNNNKKKIQVFFYDACIYIWQQLRVLVCAICLKLRWCNDYCVMVWLGDFCSSIQNYHYIWLAFIFLWKLQNLITIQNTLQYSPIFFLLLRDPDSLNNKSYTKLSTISELPNEITKYWKDGPRSRMILYHVYSL